MISLKLLFGYPTKDLLCFFFAGFWELRAQMCIIYEVSENILLVMRRIRPRPLFDNKHALWTSSNKGITSRNMSVYVRASIGAQTIILFCLIYILPKHSALYLLAFSLPSAHNCWSPSACICTLYIANKAPMGCKTLHATCSVNRLVRVYRTGNLEILMQCSQNCSYTLFVMMMMMIIIIIIINRNKSRRWGNYTVEPTTTNWQDHPQ
jgi:hypothetical protein